MIFVTVGTHEQQFNRLVEYMDRLKSDEEILMQTGFSTYEPKNVKWQKFMGYAQMQESLQRARLVITHGGPSSFMEAIRAGHIPVVVPRQKQYDEHINDHQMEFVQAVADKLSILPVYDVEQLGQTIADYEEITAHMDTTKESHNAEFARKLEEIVTELVHRG